MNTPPNELIEDALRTYPLAEAPPGFSKSVLTRIKPQRRYAQVPQRGTLKFRLTWLDYALGLFMSSLPAIAFVSWAFLPRELFVRLQYQWLLLRSPAIEPIVMTSAAAMLVLAALMLLLGLGFLIRPQRFAIFYEN
jgi:hypothetical protein